MTVGFIEKKKCAGAQCEDKTDADSGFKSDAAGTFKSWFTPILVNMQNTCFQVYIIVSVSVVETVCNGSCSLESLPEHDFRHTHSINICIDCSSDTSASDKKQK